MKTDPQRVAELAAFTVGQRVQVLPHHWLFMAGARYGEVVKIGRLKVHMRADVNGVVYTLRPSGLDAI